MQERLNGKLTQPLSRSSLKALITKVPLGTAAIFGKVGAKTYTKAPKLRENPKGGHLGFTVKRFLGMYKL